MAKDRKQIPIKQLPGEYHTGIALRKIESDDFRSLDDADHSHRHDYHFFFLQLRGTVLLEIDFEKYETAGAAVFYIHPSQVHRVVKVEDTVAYLLAIQSEHINPDCVTLLAEISPAKPLPLANGEASLLAEAFRLCLSIFGRTGDKLHSALIKSSCGTLVALIISRYLEQFKSADQLSRFDKVSKAFFHALEQHFTTIKRPAGYAALLNISTPYLNECVRMVTGRPVSHHILQRTVLEAKRLLYHSDKSVKEIAAELGYDDYAYFSRLFTKSVGLSASSFRAKNLG